jgi:hypothetical protein
MMGEGLLRRFAHHAALLGMDIRRDETVAHPGESVELGRDHLAAVAGRDENRWAYALSSSRRANGARCGSGSAGRTEAIDSADHRLQ